MWVRGLKLQFRPNIGGIWKVAPYVGAWIETSLYRLQNFNRYVAPYVGAWIETSLIAITILKPCVAPYVGAWIETRLIRMFVRLAESHPMWVRGLKRFTI